MVVTLFVIWMIMINGVRFRVDLAILMISVVILPSQLRKLLILASERENLTKLHKTINNFYNSTF